jgi:cytochrome c oxidase assembly protein Cox11
LLATRLKNLQVFGMFLDLYASLCVQETIYYKTVYGRMGSCECFLVEAQKVIHVPVLKTGHLLPYVVCCCRELVVQFNADVADGMPWKFTPSQREVRVRPGQSTLAFYTAENKSETPITGVSTYNVTPMKVSHRFFIASLLKGIEG